MDSETIAAWIVLVYVVVLWLAFCAVRYAMRDQWGRWALCIALGVALAFAVAVG